MHSKIFAICLSSALINLIYYFCEKINEGHEIQSSYNRSRYAKYNKYEKMKWIQLPVHIALAISLSEVSCLLSDYRQQGNIYTFLSTEWQIIRTVNLFSRAWKDKLLWSYYLRRWFKLSLHEVDVDSSWNKPV